MGTLIISNAFVRVDWLCCYLLCYLVTENLRSYHRHTADAAASSRLHSQGTVKVYKIYETIIAKRFVLVLTVFVFI